MLLDSQNTRLNLIIRAWQTQIITVDRHSPFKLLSYPVTTSINPTGPNSFKWYQSSTTTTPQFYVVSCYELRDESNLHTRRDGYLLLPCDCYCPCFATNLMEYWMLDATNVTLPVELPNIHPTWETMELSEFWINHNAKVNMQLNREGLAHISGNCRCGIFGGDEICAYGSCF